MKTPHVALNCLINCPPSGNHFDNSAPQLSFSKENSLIRATIQPVYIEGMAVRSACRIGFLPPHAALVGLRPVGRRDPVGSHPGRQATAFSLRLKQQQQSNLGRLRVDRRVSSTPLWRVESCSPKKVARPNPSHPALCRQDTTSPWSTD